MISRLVLLNALLLPGAFIGEQLVGGNQAKAGPLLDALNLDCDGDIGSIQDGIFPCEDGFIPPSNISCKTNPPPVPPEVPELTKEESACLFLCGLLPRNPDASGRGIAAFSNRLRGHFI